MGTNLYTQEQVEQLIKNAVTATSTACVEWIKEDTDIVDVESEELISNGMLTTKVGGKGLQYYLSNELQKAGITFKFEEEEVVSKRFIISEPKLQVDIEAKKQEEIKRLELERIRDIRANKIGRLLPYAKWIDNFNDFDFDQITDEQIDEIIKESEAKKFQVISNQIEKEIDINLNIKNK